MPRVPIGPMRRRVVIIRNHRFRTPETEHEHDSRHVEEKHGVKHHAIHVARTFTVEVVLDTLGKVLYAVVSTIATIRLFK